uniref:uncharacterized protein C05D11.1-like isoform X2 n=1 Tax=Myxine glutinosa TaxID=7769 RepID=UPI00358F5AD4
MAPSGESFVLECDVPVDGNNVRVRKYRSNVSGISVCLANVEGPLVSGHFCLATEAHDDDGLPHTLEHLVFMGSEKYPYKGVLDMLANRCLAQGTNAWTDTDHTCYTISTAGSQGFLNLLPIYLDHILYPTLTESSYVTEVHHVNADGDDAGVVYCEMQARENTRESRSRRALLQSIYPGKCGYKSETGGMLENLRRSTSHMKDPMPAYIRPWLSPVPDFVASLQKIVPYPSDDESTGIVTLCWRGPMAKELFEMTAIGTLMEYMTDTPISPLQRDLVEIAEPYCNKVKWSVQENSVGCVFIKSCNVPFKKLHDVRAKVFDTLERISNGTDVLDMQRMQTVIHRQIQETINHMEEHPHESVAFHCIGHFLYGDREEELRQRLNLVETYNKLSKVPSTFWLDLLHKYFVKAPYVTVVGQPSQQLQEEMAQIEALRLVCQREQLGPQGLIDCSTCLQKANKDNERESPRELLGCFCIPSTDSIYFHPIQRYSTMLEDKEQNDNFSLTNVPFPTQVDHIHSIFVQIIAMLDTSAVPAHLKPYLTLYSEIVFESPVMRDGDIVSHTEVIRQLAADTVKSCASLGIKGSRFRCGIHGQLLCFILKVEMDKYLKGVQWLNELLHQVVIVPERVRMVATKILNEIPCLKQEGCAVATTIIKELNFNSESNHVTTGMVRQQHFLLKLLERLQKEPSEVLTDLETLKKILVAPENLRIHISANLDSLSEIFPSPHLALRSALLKDNHVNMAISPNPLKESHYFLRQTSPIGVIVGVGAVESSYLIQTVPCVTSCLDPNLPAIMVFIEYLTALEGPMWRQVRGLGLAYHYSMRVDPSEGLLYFMLYKSSQLVSAYKQAMDILAEYVSEESIWETISVEAAVSSVIYEIVERETTVSEAALQSLISSFRGIDNKTLLKKVSQVGVEDLRRVGSQYFSHLFNSAFANCIVVCNPSRVEEIVKGLKGLSRDLVVWTNLDDNFQ